MQPLLGFEGRSLGAIKQIVQAGVRLTGLGARLVDAAHVAAVHLQPCDAHPHLPREPDQVAGKEAHLVVRVRMKPERCRDDHPPARVEARLCRLEQALGPGLVLDDFAEENRVESGSVREVYEVGLDDGQPGLNRCRLARRFSPCVGDAVGMHVDRRHREAFASQQDRGDSLAASNVEDRFSFALGAHPVDSIARNSHVVVAEDLAAVQLADAVHANRMVRGRARRDFVDRRLRLGSNGSVVHTDLVGTQAVKFGLVILASIVLAEVIGAPTQVQVRAQVRVWV